MSKVFVCTIALLLLSIMPVSAAELLTPDEQSFETSVTPGRWQLFTWPATAGTGAPGGFGGPNDDISGGPVSATLVLDATLGWGTSSLALYDPAIPSSEDPDAGGVMITLDVVQGATYTISGYIKFATNPAGNYNSAAGLTIDTNGGTNPSLAEYGVEGAGTEREFDYKRGTDTTHGNYDPAFLSGNWMWNGTFVANMDLYWWGPQFITREVTATGNTMTVFLYALNKNQTQYVLFDGISVDGQAPPPYNPASADRWSLYR